MKCKVAISHNVCMPVGVVSQERTGWIPAGFDSKVGIANEGEWKCEIEDDVTAIKAFDDNHVDRCSLSNWLSNCIQERYKVAEIPQAHYPIISLGGNLLSIIPTSKERTE